MQRPVNRGSCARGQNTSSAVGPGAATQAVQNLNLAFGLKRFIASTYQAVSGGGLAGVDELDEVVGGWETDWVQSRHLRVTGTEPHPR